MFALIKVRSQLRIATSQMSLPNIFRGVLIASCAFVVSSCAYRMGSGERAVPGNYRTVAVPVFTNNTNEAGLEVYFTNAFVRELQRSRVGLYADKADAQTVLEGVVTSVDYIATSTSKPTPDLQIPSNTVLNTIYRIKVSANLQLLRSSDRKILWAGNFEKEQSYSTPRIGIAGLTSANALYNQSARDTTLQALASEMMLEAHDRMMESF